MPLHTPVLAEVALSLGSDVLACLRSRPARMRGIGEIVEPLPNARELEVVLANPGRPLATSEVFAAVRPERFGRRENALPAASDWAWLQGSRNDLELPARALMPVIGELLATLAARPGCRLARMSGSGPTCFGLFDHPSEARAAAAEIAAAEPGWWVTACRTGPGE
jgi:4-diphosphocytidyl-2-C-methyl-D-erythritol kinase